MGQMRQKLWGKSAKGKCFIARKLIYIGINASLSEFGVGTYNGAADWLKSTGVSVETNRYNCPAISGKWFTKQPVAHTC